MQPRRMTIQDVADAAGVSVTTVSHALNGKGRVEASTLVRVRAAADSLGYTPNRAARGLASGKTYTIGLSLPDIAAMSAGELIGSDWYGQLVVHASQRTLSHHYALAVLPHFTSLAELRRYGVDGVVVLDAAPKDPRLKALARLEIPHVTTDRDPSRPQTLCVRADGAAGVDLLVDHLAQQGASRILFIAPDSPQEYFAVALRRVRERSAAAVKTSIEIVPTPTDGTVDRLYARVRAATSAALGRRDRPDAIVGMLEGFGSNIIAAATAHGLSVPEDLLVAQDIDGVSTRLTPPGITALDQNASLVAETAVDLLVDLIRGAEGLASREIPAQLVVRASTSRS